MPTAPIKYARWYRVLELLERGFTTVRWFRSGNVLVEDSAGMGNVWCLTPDEYSTLRSQPPRRPYE